MGLFAAVSEHDVRFNQLQRGTADRIRYKRVNERTGDEVPAAEIVKGREVAPGQWVVVTQEDLDSLAPARSRTLDVRAFVDLGEVDPVFFAKTYWLGPATKDAVKPYALLADTMARSGKAAVGTLVMRGKEHLAAIRAPDGVLALHTLYFADEVRSPRQEIDLVPEAVEFSERESALATQLVEAMTVPWSPQDFRDDFAEQVEAMVRAKAEGMEVTTTAEAPARIASNDLLASLLASLDSATPATPRHARHARHGGHAGHGGRAGGSGAGPATSGPARARIARPASPGRDGAGPYSAAVGPGAVGPRAGHLGTVEDERGPAAGGGRCCRWAPSAAPGVLTTSSPGPFGPAPDRLPRLHWWGRRVRTVGVVMRVGLVAPPWVSVPPPSYGGTEVVVDGLARGLASEGIEVLLYTVGDSSCPVPTAWRYPSAFVPMGAVQGEAAHVLDAYDALAGMDVIHDHTLLGPLVAPAGRRPAVLSTCHLALAPDFRRIYAEVARRVPAVAISHDQRRRAPDVGFVEVVHHGLDLERFPVGAGDGGFALYLGRMSPDKGPDLAIRIAERAGIPLVMAAKMREADEVAYFEDQVRPLLNARTEFIGEVGEQERLLLLQGAAALLNPLRWAEPFGLVMIEALACGTPVITSAWGSGPEIVDDGCTGSLCTDEDGFVAALTGADRLDRGACRAAAVRRFSVARMVDDYLRLYRRLAGAGPAAAGDSSAATEAAG